MNRVMCLQCAIVRVVPSRAITVGLNFSTLGLRLPVILTIDPRARADTFMTPH